MLKRVLSMLLIVSMMSMACNPASGFAQTTELNTLSFRGMNDPALLPYIEDTLYDVLVSSLDSDQYFIENVSALYISQEYLDELAYNSQTNIFFGFTLAELDEQFQGEKYVFTMSSEGNTTVEPFAVYDDTYKKVIRNVAVGTGVILVCVTVSVVSGGVGVPEAVSMIFSAAAKTGMACAVSGGVFGSVSAGIVTGIQTGDMDAALKAAALSGSEGFMWGAISGTIVGGVDEAVAVKALKGATQNGLTLKEAAVIQKESGYPIDVIKGFKNMDQYNICKEAGLKPQMLNGKTMLIRSIDLDFTDEFGQTNLQRMQQGLAALDPATGASYELHHIGQKMDSTLAILTKAEHMQNGNNLIWHELGKSSSIDRDQFTPESAVIWKSLAQLMIGGN